ncbi:hypothetical protein BOTBODRAFT_360594 [Botryobasidium botryosum FD-172 SS1]|uniref:Uncharacterized protein n=1 Tax=Botryobasidium botryosum (strain FD-172 SS1) TaxID=930990 RepID=A0A067MQC6_BOTB1|nr:hypothetical protein BOTBODRAFT_360594 [Botryobasidium botryosum FD-172 SS1]
MLGGVRGRTINYQLQLCRGHLRAQHAQTRPSCLKSHSRTNIPLFLFSFCKAIVSASARSSDGRTGGEQALRGRQPVHADGKSAPSLQAGPCAPRQTPCRAVPSVSLRGPCSHSKLLSKLTPGDRTGANAADTEKKEKGTGQRTGGPGLIVVGLRGAALLCSTPAYI